MYWANLNEQMLLNSDDTGNTFRWRTDIDSILILARRADAFKARRGVIQINSTPPYGARRCQNVKMISVLTTTEMESNDYGLMEDANISAEYENHDNVQAYDFTTTESTDTVDEGGAGRPNRFERQGRRVTTSRRDRFHEFVLCGVGDDRIFVLIEIVPELTVYRHQEGKRLEKLHLSYIKDVIQPSVKDLNTKGETLLTFGSQQQVPSFVKNSAIGEKLQAFNINVHSSDWTDFCKNLNRHGQSWMRASGVDNVYFYSAVHGRRFRLNEAIEYIKYVCDPKKKDQQILCQIHLAETITPPLGGAGFINVERLKGREGQRLNLRRQTLNIYRPFGLLDNVGHFSSFLDIFGERIFEPLHTLTEEDCAAAAAGEDHSSTRERIQQQQNEEDDSDNCSENEFFYGGYSASYIQAYDPLVHVLRKRFKMTHTIAPAFLLGLFTKRAKESQYIETAELLKSRADCDLRNWRDFFETTHKYGTRLRIEVVLNFKSTADGSFQCLTKNLVKIEKEKKIPAMLKYFCERKLITICLNGWREHILSTGGSCLEILTKEWVDKIQDDDHVRKNFHEIEETSSYFEEYGLEIEEEEQENDEYPSATRRPDNYDPRRYHVVFAECFQFVYDAETRLLQLALGNVGRYSFDYTRWKLHRENDARYNLTIRTSADGGGLGIHERQTLSIAKYRPINKMPVLTACPTQIFPPQFRNVAQWIWSTTPKISSLYELREMSVFRYYRWQVERLIHCMGLRFWSRVGSPSPRDAETAFAKTRIDDHTSKRNYTICGSVSPETVAKWIIAISENEKKKSISEILNDVAVVQPMNEDFKNVLINYVREHVFIFPDLSSGNAASSSSSAAAAKEYSFTHWRFVATDSDEESVWTTVLNILKLNLKIPAKHIKLLPKNVSANWQFEIIEVLREKVSNRKHQVLSALVALTVAINIMGNIPISARNLPFPQWNSFMLKERPPVFLLKKLSLVKTPGSVFQDMDCVSQDWQRTFSSRYEQRMASQTEIIDAEPAAAAAAAEDVVVVAQEHHQQNPEAAVTAAGTAAAQPSSSTTAETDLLPPPPKRLRFGPAGGGNVPTPPPPSSSHPTPSDIRSQIHKQLTKLLKKPTQNKP